MNEVFIVEWESPRHGSMRAVFPDFEACLALEARIVGKWGAGEFGARVNISREPVRALADVQSIDIN